MDNRYLAATDYFAAAGYRSLGTYYPEYAAHAALGNSYLDVSGTVTYALAVWPAGRPTTPCLRADT